VADFLPPGALKDRADIEFMRQTLAPSGGGGGGSSHMM
jgi:hypothetical protein